MLRVPRIDWTISMLTLVNVPRLGLNPVKLKVFVGVKNGAGVAVPQFVEPLNLAVWTYNGADDSDVLARSTALAERITF